MLLNLEVGFLKLFNPLYSGHARIQRGAGGRGPGPPSLKNHKNKGCLSNTDPLKNHKATKQVFNVWPSLTRQRNAIQMVFRWRAVDGPRLVVLRSPQTKTSKLDPL